MVLSSEESQTIAFTVISYMRVLFKLENIIIIMQIIPVATIVKEYQLEESCTIY